MFAQIVDGNFDFADVCFLVAIIVFVVYALVGFATAVDARIHTLLLGVGLAATALGLFVT